MEAGLAPSVTIGRPVRHLLPPGGIYLLLSVAGCIAWLAGADGLAVGPMALILALGGLVAFTVQRAADNGRFVLEPPLVLAWVIGVWHFSFWVVYYVGIASPGRVNSYFATAFDAREEAMLAALIGLFAYLAGARFAMAGQPWRRPRLNTGSNAPLVGVLACASALTVVFLLAGGTSLIGTYEDVFLGDDPLRRLYNLGAIGVLAAIGPALLFAQDRREVLLALLAAAPALGVSLLLGTRWIFFTAVIVGFVVLSLRGSRIRLWAVVAVAASLVVLGIATKEFRAGNVASIGELPTLITDRSTNPLLELPEELGQSHIPTAAEIERHQQGAEFTYGESFLASATSIIPSLPSVLYPDGFYRPGDTIAEEYFGSRFLSEGFTPGYSLLAELFGNFNLVGVLVGFSVLGLGVGRLYRRSLIDADQWWLAGSVALTAVLLFGVRNDSFTWLRYSVWILVAGLAVRWMVLARARSNSAGG